MRRGDIWTAAGAGYLSKPRPVIVVQDDTCRHFDSVIVCLLTTDAHSERFSTRVRISPSAENGLETISYAMTDKLVTLKSSRLGRCVGHLSARDLEAVSSQMARVLGLG